MCARFPYAWWFFFFFFFIFTRGTPRIIAVRCPILVGSWPWNEYRFKPWPFMKRNFSFFFFLQLDDCAYCFPFLYLSILRLCSSYVILFLFRASFRELFFFFLLFSYTDFNFLRKGKREHWFHSFIHKMILYKRSKFVQVEFQVEYRNLLLKYCVTLSLYDIPRY